jgi:hypothetical protein
VIRGIFAARQEAYLKVRVYIPPPLHVFIEVPFLVDTGAEISCLMPGNLDELDAVPIEVLKGMLAPAPTILRTPTGRIPHGATRASLGMTHEDGDFSSFGLHLRVVTDDRFLGFPSLLGRDVLFRGQVSVGRDGVFFDVAGGEHDLVRA